MHHIKLARFFCTEQTSDGRAQQLLVDVATSRRLPSTSRSVQKQQRHSSLHATLDPDDASVSSSKIVNRNSRQKSFRGKPPKADWEQSIGKVRRRLRSAVMKSHSTEGDILVRAVASAFFDSEHGLQACAKGFLMAPVSYSVVAWYIRRDTDLKFADDFDNWHASEDDAVIGQDKMRNLAANCQDEASGMPDLTSLLDNQYDCRRFFTVLRSQDSNQQDPQELQPYVIADLQALIEGSQLQKVQDVLSQVQYLTVHPEDPAYQTEFNRLKTIS